MTVLARKEERLFVNKKKQKNFDSYDVALPLPRTPEGEQKFFASFFQKRSSSLRSCHPQSLSQGRCRSVSLANMPASAILDGPTGELNLTNPAPVLLVERPEEGIVTLTLNRPEKLNAFSAELIELLLAALDEIRFDPTVRVVIITGAGRGFCSGADLTGRPGIFCWSLGGFPWPCAACRSR
jgi:hypothetical protein